jgi:hypothetical protein
MSPPVGDMFLADMTNHMHTLAGNLVGTSQPKVFEAVFTPHAV